MSCFQLPKNLLSELDSIMSRFWWDNGNKNTKSIGWRGRNYVLPNQIGALVFRDLYLFNLALLAKQG
jgi:hypothetical protein